MDFIYRALIIPKNIVQNTVNNSILYTDETELKFPASYYSYDAQNYFALHVANEFPAYLKLLVKNQLP